MSFWTKLESSARSRNSLLCVGLDPRHDRLMGAASIAGLNARIVEATKDVACAFKPNIAFYEALGEVGLAALRETLASIPDDIPVILDAKRNDIGATADAYARAVFDVWGADAVTVNPYLGHDGVEPFLAYRDRGVFLLCKTSNPGAADLQDLTLHGEPLYRAVARLAVKWAKGAPIGLVAGATYPGAIADIRADAPDAWLLVPGVGAQGGELDGVVRAGLRRDGLGLLINASRSIMYADDPRGEAKRLRDEINRLREVVPCGPTETRIVETREIGGLARALFDAGCICLGDYVLHSGAHSPIYVDLRRLASYPRLLEQVAAAYRRKMRPLQYDRIAAIPYAGLPIGTAVCLLADAPLIYPRRETKDYGTRRQIEGDFVPGEKVLVLDDLISTGGSKLEAIEPLLAAGLIVRDVIVLIDREQGGREDLARHGYRLHAVMTLSEVVDALRDQGCLSAHDAQVVHAYLTGQR